MKKAALNFWIDTVTFLVLLLEIWTGLLIHFVLPPRQGRGTNWLLWGLNRHDYGTIHFYLSVIMVVLVLIHLWLHWSWVCSVCRNLLGLSSLLQKNRQLLWGLGLLLVVSMLIMTSLFWVNMLVVK